MWWRLLLTNVTTAAAFVVLWVVAVFLFQQFAPCAWLTADSTPNNRAAACAIAQMESLQ